MSIERQFGCVKYAVRIFRPSIVDFLSSCLFQSFLVVATLLVTALELLSLLALHRVGPSFNVIPSGPVGLAFGLLYQYFVLVPATYHFRVFGVTFSNKVFLYTLALLVSNPLRP